MNHPVKLSETLVLDARLTGQAVRRSIAGQIEFWANVGRAVEPLLRGDIALGLCRAGAAHPLSECLDSVDSPDGRQHLADYLAMQPYPHYEPVSEEPGLLVRTEANGRRTIGRFVNRKFQAAQQTKAE